MQIKLVKVKFMPKHLEPGILYVSYEYETAAHLCACGCGVKIRTPLGPTEWEITEDRKGPSLWPSVGNWQQKCKSHYVIRDGNVIWADSLSDKKIEAGRRKEQLKRELYYKKLALKPHSNIENESKKVVSTNETTNNLFYRLKSWLTRLLS